MKVTSLFAKVAGVYLLVWLVVKVGENLEIDDSSEFNRSFMLVSCEGNMPRAWTAADGDDEE